MFSMAPVMRTPLDKRSGDAIGKQAKEVQSAIESLAPWVDTDRVKRSRYRGKVKSGTIAVFMDAGDDPKSEVFRGAAVNKKR